MNNYCLIGKMLLIFLCLSFSASHGFAQDYIHSGDIELKTQVHVNNFANTNPLTTIIKGNLMIGDFVATTNITDLSPLTQLLIVEGSLVISKTSISSLKGLHKLVEANILVIDDNDKLTSLKELSALEKIHGSLQVDRNDLIQNFIGLEQIEQIGDSIGDYFQVYNNANLQSFDGLENLLSIADNFNIGFNPSLSSFEALISLQQVGNSLIFRNNDSIRSFAGLDSLSFLGGALYIEGNPALTSFEHLGKFDSVFFHLSIKNNAGITSMKGLENIVYIDDDLTIYYNPLLSGFEGLEKLEYIGGELEIEKNPAITNLQGLENLSYIRSSLELNTNAALSSLRGINTQVTLNGGVEISNNPMLALCGESWICSAIKNDKYAYFFNNKQGCNTAEEVSKSCGITGLPAPHLPQPRLTWVRDRELILSPEGHSLSKLDVYTILGKAVFSADLRAAEDTETFRLPDFPPGLFLVRISSPGRSYTWKFIKASRIPR